MVDERECTDRNCPAHGELVTLRQIVAKVFDHETVGYVAFEEDLKGNLGYVVIDGSLNLDERELAAVRAVLGEEARDGSTK